MLVAINKRTQTTNFILKVLTPIFPTVRGHVITYDVLTGSTGDLKFENIITSLKAAVMKMLDNHPKVDIIIALGHAGFEIDKQIAREVDGIDIVVGGHSGTFLWNGKSVHTLG